jgi:hypothetical protein
LSGACSLSGACHNLPAFSSQLGSQKVQQGLFQLGAAGDAPYKPPSMPTSARPWMAHLYNNDWSFRASLGAIIGTRPVLQQTINSGFQPVTIELPTLNTTIQPGNLIVLTEEGGDATGTAPAGIPVIGGIVEIVPDTLQVSGWSHQVTITPFVAELGDAYLNKNYTTATDVAQMVRDAVSQTNHLRYTPTSIPNTGVTALYNFNFAPCLEVIDHARLIAGQQWSWFVDAIGVVWFQPINTNAAAMFTVTPKDYASFQSNGGDISGLKNYCLVVGGTINGVTAAPVTYNNPTSQTKYGLRAINPPISVPGITDPTTLTNIANTIGGIYDRVINRITIELPIYPMRVLLGQPGGATLRYFSPASYPMAESETGTGTYSPTYVVLAVSTDGIQQTVTIGDVPPAIPADVQYQTSGATRGLIAQPISSTPPGTPYSFADNIDATHPAYLDFELPANVKPNFAKLSFRFRLYRTYNSFTLSATGGQSVTHTHGHSHTEAAHTHHNSPTVGAGGAALSINGSTLNMASGPNSGWDTDSTTPGATGSDATGASVDHTHTVSGSSTLGVTEGIATTITAIAIDSTNITASLGGGPWASDINGLDITSSMPSGDGKWHTITLTPSGQGRMVAILRLG